MKFKLNRQYPENIYITFIRPTLEYGSEVWDDYGAVNSDRLEKVQTEAARIVTGQTSYASLDSIYCETGREKLYQVFVLIDLPRRALGGLKSKKRKFL